MNEQTIGIFIWLFIIFLIGRELVCWYWKMNETVKLLKKEIEESKKTNQLLEKLLAK